MDGVAGSEYCAIDLLIQQLTRWAAAFDVDGLYRTLAAWRLDSEALSQWLAPATTSFVLIVAAEMGDKSQLVCMTLASRHRAMPVLWGAVAAFALLNALAVVFGAAIAHWLPDTVIAMAVALLFVAFGIQSLRSGAAADDGELKEQSGRSVFLNTLVLIAIAEFGDKTQLAVAALGSTAAPAAIWLGATAALALTSAIGIWAGRALLQKMSLGLLHKISGVIFLILATAAGWRAYTGFES